MQSNFDPQIKLNIKFKNIYKVLFSTIVIWFLISVIPYMQNLKILSPVYSITTVRYLIVWISKIPAACMSDFKIVSLAVSFGHLWGHRAHVLLIKLRKGGVWQSYYTGQFCNFAIGTLNHLLRNFNAKSTCFLWILLQVCITK